MDRMRSTFGRYLVIGIVLLTASVSLAQDMPLYHALSVNQAPVIDGVLLEGVWKSAPVASGFVTNRDHKQPQHQTQFQFVYDSEHLYGFVVCHEPTLDQLKGDPDADNPWHDDCVEIFIDPHRTRKHYVQYIVNPAGRMVAGREGDFTSEVEGKVNVGRRENAWTVEIKIPFSTLNARPHVGDQWGLNVTRGREPKAEGEKRVNSLWSVTDGPHGSPGKFGIVMFASSPSDPKPASEPDLSVFDRILTRIRDELHGQWRWTEADVTFAKHNERARNLLAIGMIVSRLPDTRLLHYVLPAIRNDHILPWTVPTQTQVGGRVSIVACRGEFESASVGLFAVEDLEDVQLEFSVLRTEDGKMLPMDAIDPYHVIAWYQGGVGRVQRGAKTLLAELMMKDPTLVTVDAQARENILKFTGRPTDAQRLQRIDIPAFESRQLWITYHIPDDAPAGRYEGTIAVRDSKSELTRIPVTVRVPAWNLEPSPMWHGLYHRRRMPKVETVEEEEAFFEIYEQELRDQIEHGCNVVAEYVGVRSLPSDDSPVATVQRIHEILAKYGATDTPYFSVVAHVGFQQSPEQLEAVEKQARMLSEWAKSVGRPAFAFQGRDEASGERLREQRPSWEACRRGGAKVWVACSPDYFDVMGDILDYPVVAGSLKPRLAGKVHANGFKIFSYANPQAGVEIPEVYRRNYGIALWKAGYDGAINYCYCTIDPERSWNDFDEDHYRDHNFAYPAVNTPIDTTQFEGWREGVDDLRYLATLQKMVETVVRSGQGVDVAADCQVWIDNISGREELYGLRREMIRRADMLWEFVDKLSVAQ